MISAAFPRPALRNSALPQAAPLQFEGDQQRQEYYKWISAFPDKSLKKLGAINRAGHSTNIPPRVSHNVKHIVMAIRCTIIDPFVRELVREMISVRQHLHRAKRDFKRLEMEPEATRSQHAFERASLQREEMGEKLQDLHIAIDWATGHAPPFVIPPHRMPLVEDLRAGKLDTSKLTLSI